MGEETTRRDQVKLTAASNLARENNELLNELSHNQAELIKEIREVRRTIKTGISLIVKLPFSVAGIGVFIWMFIPKADHVINGVATGWIPLWFFGFMCLAFMYPFYGEAINLLLEKTKGFQDKS